MTKLSDILQHMARGGYRLHKEWGLMAPESPTIDEGPDPTVASHKHRTAPHGQPEDGTHATHNRSCTESTPCPECRLIIEKAHGFDGTQENPLPLGGE